jgi:hypothetical protein
VETKEEEVEEEVRVSGRTEVKAEEVETVRVEVEAQATEVVGPVLLQTPVVVVGRITHLVVVSNSGQRDDDDEAFDASPVKVSSLFKRSDQPGQRGSISAT